MARTVTRTCDSCGHKASKHEALYWLRVIIQDESDNHEYCNDETESIEFCLACAKKAQEEIEAVFVRMTKHDASEA